MSRPIVGLGKWLNVSGSSHSGDEPGRNKIMAAGFIPPEPQEHQDFSTTYKCGHPVQIRSGIGAARDGTSAKFLERLRHNPCGKCYDEGMRADGFWGLDRKYLN